MTEATPRPLRMHSRQMFDALTEAGIIRKDDYVSRVVIDVEIGKAVVLRVERFGDTRLLSLVPQLELAEEAAGGGDPPAADSQP